MFRFLIRRLLWAVFLFIAVTIVTYVIFFLAPAEPGAAHLRRRARAARVPRATRARTSALDKPIYVQYGKFLKRLVIDRLARQVVHHRADGQRHHLDAAPVTASLVFGGAILWMMIGLTRRGSSPRCGRDRS